MSNEKDTIVRRVVVEYGHWYVYLYITDGNGRVLDEDTFKQPFRLERKDISDEATDCYQNTYQWISDITVFSASIDPEPPESDEED